jgi:hypothetical protein
MPKIVFVLPIRKAKPGNNKSVHLGFRITNNTSQPYCFSFCRHLIPEIIADGNNINGGHQYDLFLPAEQSDFHLTQPGKSVRFSQPARFSWQRKYNNRRKQDRNLVLSLPFTSCGFFIFQLINWAGWNVLIQDNDFQVYRHQLKDSEFLSNDGGGIVIHACCGGTSVRQAEIVGNTGNSYIGISQVPRIRDVRIFGNKLLSNVKGDLPLIYVNADTEQKINQMQNAIVENNTVKGSLLAVASQGGRGNAIRNNSGFNVGSIKYSCHVTVSKNKGFVSFPCWRRRNVDGG